MKLKFNSLVLFLFFILENRITKTGAVDYIGCFEDSNDDRLLPDRVSGGGFSYSSLTVEYCQTFCFHRHRTSHNIPTYFGTEDGAECYCGNDYGRHGSAVSDSECNSPCSGQRDKHCGGTSRISVYYVCPRGLYGLNCTERCGHCEKDYDACFRENGSCVTGKCEDGWTGHDCKQDPEVEQISVLIVWITVLTSLLAVMCLIQFIFFHCLCKALRTIRELRYNKHANEETPEESSLLKLRNHKEEKEVSVEEENQENRYADIKLPSRANGVVKPRHHIEEDRTYEAIPGDRYMYENVDNVEIKTKQQTL